MADQYFDDYYKVQIAEANDAASQAQAANVSAISGTSVGEVAIWNGAIFTNGALIGDSNGISVSVFYSPSFGLQVALNPTTARTAMGIDAIALKKSNLAASAAPGTGDDSADGYAIGSVWIDTTADDVYMCCDASVGAAVWKKLSP